jgi:CubicO group peptidase (beta-lactamase class C family)
MELYEWRSQTYAFLISLITLMAVGCNSTGALIPGDSKRTDDLKVRHDPELSAKLEQVRSAHGVPGMGVAVLLNYDVAISVAGKRRVDRGELLQDTDAFHLGSDTKALTASLFARLVDRGVLHWNESLAEAMPDFGGMDPAFRDVTVEMLMRHVAGLPGSGAFTPEFTRGFDENWPIKEQRKWMAERFLSRAPKQSPGTRFEYSNYGYLIIGHIVERATGKTWEELVQQEVFEPLAMRGCGFGPTSTSLHPDGNWAHDVKGDRYIATEEDNPQLIGPAGTVYCNLESWARFAAAHAHPNSGRWLTPASMGHLHEPFTVIGIPPGKDIGLGWGITHTQPPRLTHSGSNGYNFAEIVVIPQLRAAVLVTCNAGDARGGAAAKEASDFFVAELLRTVSDGKGIPIELKKPKVAWLR